MPTISAPARAMLIGAATAAALALAGCGSAASTVGSMVSGNDDPFAIEVGDCVNEALLSGGGDETDSIPVVPCDEPHDSEVYAAFDVDYAEFPGVDQLQADGEERCLAEFEPFIGVPYDQSAIYFSSYYPTEGSWNELDDREILCIAFLDGEQATGSLAGAGY